MEKTERKWSARITDGRTIGRKCAFVVGLHNDSIYEDCIASIELNHKEDADDWFGKYSRIAECMNTHSELEAKANISDEAIEAFQKIIRNQCDEISALKEKAEAYDRLMSGEYTLKDLSNIFQMYSAIDADGYARLFADPPFIENKGWTSNFPEDEFLIPGIVKHVGDWKDSLTLPDGWEE